MVVSHDVTSLYKSDGRLLYTDNNIVTTEITTLLKTMTRR